MPSPIEIISSTRTRIARIAAVRAFVMTLLPAVTAFVLAWFAPSAGVLIGTRFGFVLTADGIANLREVMVVVGGACLVVGGWRAIGAWRRANDFVGAAGQIDYRLRGHDEIVTLATLADPSHPQASRARRSPLFPVLWRRAIAYFEGFDPKSEFRFELRGPLRRSSMYAIAIAGVMLLATLGLVRPPSPEMAEAVRLNQIAREIEKSATNLGDLALASKLHEAASALANPKLPREEKVKRLEQVMREIESQQEGRKGDNGNSPRASSGASSNGASGKSPDLNAKGESKGQGNGQGTGKGQGNSGQNGGNKTSAKNESGGESRQQNKGGEDRSIELQNELAKAEAQVETENGANKNPERGSDSGNQPGNSAKPGKNAKQKGGNQPNPNEPGNIPQQGMRGIKNLPSGGNSGGKDQGSNLGDTHLGEIPAPADFQRFLKPGEKGAGTDIRDARYVMFRLPNAAAQAGSGRTVLDSNRPKASTPYTNAPLAPTSDDAPPDERQLVPPRYRELIH